MVVISIGGDKVNDNQRQNNDIGRQKIDNVESKRQKPTPTAKFIPRYEDDISQKKDLIHFILKINIILIIKNIINLCLKREYL